MHSLGSEARPYGLHISVGSHQRVGTVVKLAFTAVGFRDERVSSQEIEDFNLLALVTRHDLTAELNQAFGCHVMAFDRFAGVAANLAGRLVVQHTASLLLEGRVVTEADLATLVSVVLAAPGHPEWWALEWDTFSLDGALLERLV